MFHVKQYLAGIQFFDILISMSIATGRRSDITKYTDMKTQYNRPDIVPGTTHFLNN